MKTAIKATLIIALVFGLIFVAGCTQSYGDYDTSTPVPRGGGCGVSAPANANSELAQVSAAIAEDSSF